jgi:hypothetical protein
MTDTDDLSETGVRMAHSLKRMTRRAHRALSQLSWFALLEVGSFATGAGTEAR